MKILLVTEPGVNGVFRYVEALADFYMEQRMEVHLAYSDRRGCDRLGELVARVERNGGRTVNLRTTNHPQRADVRALRVLRALAAEVRPDIVHSHSSKAGALARALPFTGLRGARYVHHPHAFIGMRPKRGRLDGVYDLVDRVLARWSTTVCCSQDEVIYARDALRIAPERRVYLPNGVNLARFFPPAPEERARLRERFGLPATGLVLGAMGRTSDQKDPLTMYRAFARAAKIRDDVTFFHLGCGELDAEVAAFIRDRGLQKRVVRLEYLATPADFYKAVDGFILTSRYEGFSLTLLEALASDLPLIVSQAPGNNDMIALPLTQLWSAPIGDDAGFSQAIVDWAGQRSRPEPPHVNHREVAQEHFDVQRCFTKLLGLYRDLLGNGPAPAKTTAETVVAR